METSSHYVGHTQAYAYLEARVLLSTREKRAWSVLLRQACFHSEDVNQHGMYICQHGGHFFKLAIPLSRAELNVNHKGEIAYGCQDQCSR